MYEVSAEWMKACGKGDEAKVFRVIRSYEAGGWPFVVLDEGEGREWIVMAAWRGRYV
jgi:hypothetical protein